MKTSSLLTLTCFTLLCQPLVADDQTAATNAATTNAPATAPAAAKPVLYELAKIKGADVSISEDDQAIGGEYVMNHQPYNPVLFMDTPAGDELTIWGHIRGSSFQIKAVIDGKQQELDWIWGTAGQFTWKKFGTYPRAKLGDQFVIIRGDKADPTDGIDCILVSPDPDYSPDQDKNILNLLAP